MGGKLTLIAILCVILADYLHYYLVKGLRNIQEICIDRSFYEIVDLIRVHGMCSKPKCCSKIYQKGKNCLRLPDMQKVAPKTKSCSKDQKLLQLS